MFCSKSTTERTRECMRQYRIRSRNNEILKTTQNGQKEDLSMDTSNIMNIATNDMTNDPINITIDSRSASPIPESSNDEESSLDDITNDEFEDENDNDNIDEYILLYDLNNQTKLFSSCPLSIREACHAIIRLARRLNLDKSGIEFLLNDIRCLFPMDVKLPRTLKGLMKI
ncbi:unnamed protein product, partial [Rotaria sp. Silwood2]